MLLKPYDATLSEPVRGGIKVVPAGRCVSRTADKGRSSHFLRAAREFIGNVERDPRLQAWLFLEAIRFLMNPTATKAATIRRLNAECALRFLSTRNLMRAKKRLIFSRLSKNRLRPERNSQLSSRVVGAMG